MEIDGNEAWKLLRPSVVAHGPRRVLRKMVHADVGDEAYRRLNRRACTRVLWLAGRALKPGEDARDAATDVVAAVGRPRRRLSPTVAAAADVIALVFLDSWAKDGDNPGALVSDHVLQALGTCEEVVEIDGVPGSAQSISVWRLGVCCFLTGEGGVSGIGPTAAQVLEDWREGV